MQWGWTADEATAFEVMDAFVETSGNFIDTADVYSFWADDNPGGVSEQIIGRWMKERNDVTPLQVALAWQLAQPVFTSPIIGANSVEQLQDSIKSVNIELNKEDIVKLNEASAWVEPL